MIVGPLLKWKIGYGFDGLPIVERGIESVAGGVVLVCGIATMACGGIGRLLPLAVVPGLVGGAITGLVFLEVMATRFIPDGSTETGLGLVMSMGGAALAGAAGVVGLSVAAAVHAVKPHLRAGGESEY